MTALLERLPEEAKARLRAAAAGAEDLDWPGEIARREGWLAANQQYQTAQRAQGLLEMRSLLDTLGIGPPLAPDVLQEVLLTAIEVYLQTDGISARARVGPDGVQLFVSRCPIFDRFSDPSWHGLTACGCFARRQGWYDALGIASDEEPIMNRKWDDPVCHTAIHIPLTES